MDMLGGKFGLNIVKADAAKRFLDKLAGVSDPEQKRKIIGNEFVYVFDDEASKLKDVKFLAQGTLYTDVIESGTDTAQTIKSHHNVGGLPEDMQFELIEPLNTLYKDESSCPRYRTWYARSYRMAPTIPRTRTRYPCHG